MGGLLKRWLIGWSALCAVAVACHHNHAQPPPPDFDDTAVTRFARTEVHESVASGVAASATAGRQLAEARRELLAAYNESITESFATVRREWPDLPSSGSLEVGRTRAALEAAERRRDALIEGAFALAVRWLAPLRQAERYLVALSAAIEAVAEQEPGRDRRAFLERYQRLSEAYNRWADVASAEVETLNAALEAALLPPGPEARATSTRRAFSGDWPATWPQLCADHLGGHAGASAGGLGELSLAARLGELAARRPASGLSVECREALRPLLDALVACRSQPGSAADALSQAEVVAIVSAAAERFSLEWSDRQCLLDEE